MNRILSLVSVVALCTAVPVDTHAQTSFTADGNSCSRAVITEYPTASAMSFPQGIDIDEDGNIWYAETGAGKLAVLRPNHTTSEYPVPNGGQPITPKVAKDGIWFTDGANHAIGNLNPDTGKIVEYPFPYQEITMRRFWLYQGHMWWASPANGVVGYFYLAQNSRSGK